jgi:uncharacterized protein (TIGR02466 family)
MAAEEKRKSVAQALAEGVSLQRAGKIREAESIYRRVLEAAPDHADALHLLGVAARQSGRNDEAIDLIGRAIAANPQNATYHSNLGTAFEAAGRREEALSSYRRAVEIKKDFPEAQFKLGSLLQAMGKNGLAAQALRRAVELRPDNANWHLLLGTALAASGKHEQAAVVLRRAAELDPKLADAHHRQGLSFLALKRRDEALAAFRRAVAIDPRHDAALFSLACHLMEDGDAQGVLAACDEVFARDPGNCRMVSWKIAALTELGKRDEAMKLLDFDRFVRPVEVTAPEGYADVAAFNAALVGEVTTHPTLVFEKSGHATRHGGHTGDILIDPGPAVAALEAFIRQAVADYERALDCDPDHPLRAAKPDRWRLQAWAVVMDTKGHQLPHIHPAAWISGVYYPKIPISKTPPRDPHAGWIEFGRPQDNMHTKAEPDVRLYRPKEGLMFLFPSYLYHMTIPNEAGEQRISIAFDMVDPRRARGAPY